MFWGSTQYCKKDISIKKYIEIKLYPLKDISKNNYIQKKIWKTDLFILDISFIGYILNKYIFFVEDIFHGYIQWEKIYLVGYDIQYLDISNHTKNGIYPKKLDILDMISSVWIYRNGYIHTDITKTDITMDICKKLSNYLICGEIFKIFIFGYFSVFGWVLNSWPKTEKITKN